MNEQIADQVLVNRVLGGDKNAFNLLVTRYQSRLLHLVSQYVLPAEAPDVVQESFIKAYRSLGSFKGESVFYTWLYRIAVNTAKNHLVFLGRRPPASDIDVDDAVNYESGDYLRDIDSPEKIALSEEIKKTVFDTINQLPEDLKTTIMLREIDGLGYEEIAEIMDIPVGTVRSRLFRAREIIDVKLKQLL